MDHLPHHTNNTNDVLHLILLGLIEQLHYVGLDTVHSPITSDIQQCIPSNMFPLDPNQSNTFSNAHADTVDTSDDLSEEVIAEGDAVYCNMTGGSGEHVLYPDDPEL